METEQQNKTNSRMTMNDTLIMRLRADVIAPLGRADGRGGCGGG